MKWEMRLSKHQTFLGKKIVRAFEKVTMCYFNPSETNHTELVKDHHCKEVEKKWISEETRNSPDTVTVKGTLRKQLAYSFLFTKLLDDLALPS